MKFEVLKCIPFSMLALMIGCGSEGSGEEAAPSSQAVFTTIWSGTFSRGASDNAVVSRGTNLLDRFFVSSGNVIYSRYASSNWQPDVSLGAPSGTTLMRIAAANNGGRIDLFAVGSDNHIWHRSSDITTGAPTFTPWSADIYGNPTIGALSPLAVTSWAPGRLDVFWFTPNRAFGHAWGDGYTLGGVEAGSSTVPYLLPLISFDGVSDLTAVSDAPGRVHVFAAAGPNLEHHWYAADGGGWGATGTEHRELLPTNTPDGPLPQLMTSSVAAASRGPNNMELFIGALSGNNRDVYHIAFNNSWSTFSMGTRLVPRFERVTHTGTSPPLQVDSALAWSDGGTRLDVFGANWQALTR